MSQEMVLSKKLNGEGNLILSRKLSATEQMYEAIEREALAIKWAIYA